MAAPNSGAMGMSIAVLPWLWVSMFGAPGGEAGFGAHLQVEGGAGASQRKALEVGFQRGLAPLEGFERLGDAVEGRPAAECFAAAQCRTALHDRGMAYAIVGRVVIEDRNFSFEVRAIDLADGREVTKSVDSCDLCGISEAEELLARQTSSVVKKVQTLEMGPATVSVTTTPAGAEVIVDGVSAGTAPLELKLDDGEHTIVATAAGYEEQRRTIAAVSGTSESLKFRLNRAAPPPAQPVDDKLAKRRLLWPVGWATLGVGAVATGVGAAFLAIEERPYRADCSGDNVDAAGQCRYRYDTLVPGAVLTGVGVAMIATGTALVIVGAKARKRTDGRRAHLIPNPRGLAVRFGL